MSDKPKRIQRKRTAGWRMPEGAIYVGRPTKWGNPYQVGKETEESVMVETVEQAIVEYRADVEWPEIAAIIADELRGHDLACWCKAGDPCHADVLLEMANE